MVCFCFCSCFLLFLFRLDLLAAFCSRFLQARRDSLPNITTNRWNWFFGMPLASPRPKPTMTFFCFEKVGDGFFIWFFFSPSSFSFLFPRLTKLTTIFFFFLFSLPFRIFYCASLSAQMASTLISFPPASFFSFSSFLFPLPFSRPPITFSAFSGLWTNASVFDSLWNLHIYTASKRKGVLWHVALGGCSCAHDFFFFFVYPLFSFRISKMVSRAPRFRCRPRAVKP